MTDTKVKPEGGRSPVKVKTNGRSAVKGDLVAVELTKPGQTAPTPTPGDGDRVFYETLLRQKPGSHMAQEWCVKHGILPHDEAARLAEVVKRRKGAAKNGSPAKAARKRPAPSNGAKKAGGRKKKAVIEDDLAGDAGMSVGGVEGVGATTI